MTSGTAATAAATAADAQRLAALSLATPDQRVAGLLAVTAYRLEDSPPTRGALLAALAGGNGAAWHVSLPSTARSLLNRPGDLDLYLLTTDDRLVDLDTSLLRIDGSFPVRADRLVGFTGRPTTLTRSAELVTAGDDGRVTVLTAWPGSVERVLTTAAAPPTGAATTTAITGDGRWVAVAERAGSRGAATRLAIYDTTRWGSSPRRWDTTSPVVQVVAGGHVIVALTTSGRAVRVDPRRARLTATTARLPGPRVTDTTLVAMSPDDRTLAVVPDDAPRSPRLVRLVPLRGTRAGPPLALPTTATPVTTMAFAADGTQVAVASSDGRITVSSTATGAVRTVLLSASPATALILSSGLTSFLYSVDGRGGVTAWDLSGPQSLLSLEPETVTAPHVAAQAGDLLAGWTRPAAGPARLVTLDLSASPLRIRSYPLALPGAGRPAGVDLSADHRRAVVSVGDARHGGRWEVYDLASGRLLTTVSAPAPSGRSAPSAPSASSASSAHAALSPDGRLLYAAVGPHTIGALDLSTRRWTTWPVRWSGSDASRVDVEAWHLDRSGRLLVVGRDPGPAVGQPSSPYAAPTLTGSAADSRVGLLDTTTGRLVAQAGLGEDEPERVGWSPDGTVLAVVAADGALDALRGASLGRVARTLAGAPGSVTSVTVSPDDRTIVTGSTDGRLQFWDAASLAQEGPTLPAPQGDSTASWDAWFTPDGSLAGLLPDTRAGSGPTGQRGFTMPAAPSDWVADICRAAGGDLTRSEWATYVGSRPYSHSCPTRTSR